MDNRTYKPRVLKFQYISCCSLSSPYIGDIFRFLCFNTSHVVVYPHGASRRKGDLKFQYISCCSLSPLLFNLYSRNSCFNTSHVVVYRYSGSSGLFPLCSFNTSHVVVYPTGSSSSDTYYTCFNTSHVVVYQPDNAIIIPLTSFQYISCCSLSR